MAAGAVPFDDEAGMRAGTRGEAGVTAEVFLRQMEALRCGIDASSTQSVPQIAKSKQQPERNIRSISAHEIQTRRMKSDRSRPPQAATLILRQVGPIYASVQSTV